MENRCYCTFSTVLRNRRQIAFLQLNSSLKSTRESSCLVVVGAFNIPSVNWSTDESAPVNTGRQAAEESLCDVVEDNFLHQFIKGPTHIAGNKLDLLLSNCPEIVENVTNHAPGQVFPTDHYTVEFSVKLKFKRCAPVPRKVFDFSRGNFDDLRNSLRNSLILLCPRTVLMIAGKDEKNCSGAVHKFIPTKIIRDKNFPPWIDGEVRHFIRKKYDALRKFRKNRSDICKQILRELSQKVKYLIRVKHLEFLKKIEGSFKDNPKLFWSYHKAILHHCGKSNSTITHNGKTVTTPVGKAKLFNSYFSSVFRPPGSQQDTDNTNVPDYPLTEVLLSGLTVTVEGVTNHLNALDITKASGPDEIPVRLLNACCNEIAPSLCSLFNLSLKTACLPSEWKMANVTAVHKKDSLEPVSNYRPMSLLCIINKILEWLVANGWQAQVKRLISTQQRGFQRGRSCATQLLAVLHEIGKNLDQNVQTGVLYLDFEKAFDTVDHQILLPKLKRFGVVDRMHDWFKDYLHQRF